MCVCWCTCDCLVQFGSGIFPCHFFVSSRYERIPYQNSNQYNQSLEQEKNSKCRSIRDAILGQFLLFKVPVICKFLVWTILSQLNSIRFFTWGFFSWNVTIVTYHSCIVKCWQLIYFFEVRGRFLFEGLYRIPGHSVGFYRGFVLHKDITVWGQFCAEIIA